MKQRSTKSIMNYKMTFDVSPLQSKSTILSRYFLKYNND